MYQLGFIDVSQQAFDFAAWPTLDLIGFIGPVIRQSADDFFPAFTQAGNQITTGKPAGNGKHANRQKASARFSKHIHGT